MDSGYPAGKLLEKVLPTRQFTTFGYTWSLNPGKFSMKEHMVITIMANVGFATPYTTRVSASDDRNVFGPRLTPNHQIVMEQYSFGQQWASNFGYQCELGPALS
jgi:hypothetical protein